MDHARWRENLLEAVTRLGPEGRAAAGFLRTRGTRIGFMKFRPHIGAIWTVFGNIRLNSRYYSHSSSLEDLKLLTLIVHEAHHLRQGFFTALSVYGELEAWQLEFGVYHQITGQYPRSSIAELMSLPLGYDREVLRKAVVLMQAYAGKGYRADRLPLYPPGREIRYWIMRR